MTQCQKDFDLLKEALMKSPIVVYQDPIRTYALFTDPSKYAWSVIWTHRYKTSINDKEISHQHLITDVGGLYQDSQSNWAALAKEAYEIYMSIKMKFCLEDVPITLKSDHLPLKRSPQKTTLNAKVNSWGIKLSN